MPETIPNRFYPEQKTKRSFVLRHLCPVHAVKAKFLLSNLMGSVTEFYLSYCNYEKYHRTGRLKMN